MAERVGIICWRKVDQGPPAYPHQAGKCERCGADFYVALSSYRRVAQIKGTPVIMCFRCAARKPGELGILPVTKEQAAEMGRSPEEIHSQITRMLPKAHLIGD